MMKLIVLAAFVAIASADVSHLFNKPGQYHAAPVYQPQVPHVPQGQQYGGPQVKIINYKNEIYPDGTYEYAYDTENGISAQQQGNQKPVGNEYGNAAHGSFQFASPEGVPVAVSYVADENGYQPQGDVLPTPPPVPQAILRSLEFIAKNAPVQHQQQQQVPYGQRY